MNIPTTTRQPVFNRRNEYLTEHRILWMILAGAGLCLSLSRARADVPAMTHCGACVDQACADREIEQMHVKLLAKKKAAEEWYSVMMAKKGPGSIARLGIRPERMELHQVAGAAATGIDIPSEFLSRMLGRALGTQSRKDHRAVDDPEAELAALLALEEIELMVLDQYYVKTTAISDLGDQSLNVEYLPPTPEARKQAPVELTGAYNLGPVPYHVTVGANGADDDCDSQQGQIAISSGGGGGGYQIDSFFDIFTEVSTDGMGPGGENVTVSQMQLEKIAGSCDGLDHDCDGLIEGGDWIAFQPCYTGHDDGPITPYCLAADIDEDNDVDGEDWTTAKKKLNESGVLYGDPIPPGFDIFMVKADTAWIEFGGNSMIPALPADFFGPGSDPFEGQVALMQRRWAQQAEAGIRESPTKAAMVWKKKDWADLSTGSDIIEIELKELHLMSKEPIEVSYSGANAATAMISSFFDIYIEVTDNNVPPKTAMMEIRESPTRAYQIRESPTGGIGIMILFQQTWPPPMGGVADAASPMLIKWYPPSPVVMEMAGEGHWTEKEKELAVTHPEPEQGFYPLPMEEVAFLFDGGLSGGMVLTGLQATEACCLRDARCVDVTVSDCATLKGDPQGPGTDCNSVPAPVCSLLKWAQPPVPAPASNIFHGWDYYSVWDQQGDGPSNLVAADWLCETPGPVADIHWWGSYVGWKLTIPPSRDDPPIDPPVNHFHILIWTDVPADPLDPTSFSHPGEVIWESYKMLADTHEQFVGWDRNPATGEYEATFRYDVDLPVNEWFYQGPTPAPTVYWVTIAACYEPIPIFPMDYPWGWKTRPRDPNSLAPDAAVVIYNPWWATIGSTYQVGEPIRCCPPGEWDMAFELTTKMPLSILKWDQPPNRAWDTAVEINAAYPYILADDFQCETTGPLTQVSITGSWYHDQMPFNDPGQVTFTLSIHEDIPAIANPQGPWSMPGNVLWTRTFSPGSFQVVSCGPGESQAWMEPPAVYEPFADFTCWTYVFNLAPTEFIQQGTATSPIIYWLDVQAFPMGMSANWFGWKASSSHWNDDAVWNLGPEPPPPPWSPMVNPPGHPLAGQTVDLAFTIVGTSYAESSKWSQPPEPATDQCFRGWNELSWYGGPQIVADDWPCTSNLPITDIHWWGSYLNWVEQAPPADAPDRFHIGIWTDVPFMPPGFSHPGAMIAEFVVTREMLNERVVGCDSFEAGIAPETCFKYDHAPEAILFSQPDAACSIYWVSIAAIYPPLCACKGDLNGDGFINAMDLAILASCMEQPPIGACAVADINCDGVINLLDSNALQCLMVGNPPEQCCPGTIQQPPVNPWGWKTREHMFMDDAVRIFLPTAPDPGSSFEFGEPIQSPVGTSWDMAFVLTSPEQVEACCVLLGPAPGCQDLTPSQCLGLGGVRQGPGTACSVPEACCLPNDSCMMLDPLCCDELGGTPMGQGSVCGGTLEACCVETTGVCVMADPTCCGLLGGVSQGPGTQCTQTEPCCLPDGSCRMVDPLCCDELGGVASPIGAAVCMGDQNGNGTDDACEIAKVACCLQNGACVEVEYNKCVALGGDPQGPGTICDMRICPALKWAQPPTYHAAAPGGACFWGWDDLSDYFGGPVVADDWACESNQPITDVHWWGSYRNWTLPEAPPPGMGPVQFHIGIWTDVAAAQPSVETCCYCYNLPGVLPPTTCSPNPPDQPTCDLWGGGQYQQCTYFANSRCMGDHCETILPYSHPGRMVWQSIVPQEAVNERWVGCDQYPGQPGDSCFRYDFAIPREQWFYQAPSADPTIYWISISAVYLGPQPPNPWGWKTREHFFNDDAVRIFAPTAPVPGTDFLDGAPIVSPDGESWDMAFVLTTVSPGPSKWDQWPNPDLPGLHAHDGITLADNWECQGGKVTDFHWWGNYELDDQGNEERGAGIDCINISIHKNRPDVPWCVPQDPAEWGVCAFFDPLNEHFTGLYNSEGSRIYEYDFYLEPGFEQETGQIYWLNLEAFPVDPHDPALWRWQESARKAVPRLCPAAERTPSQAWHTIPPWPDDPPVYSEMAFRVTSTPYPPGPDPSATSGRNRYLSMIVPPVPTPPEPLTALRVTPIDLQNPIPPNLPLYPPPNFSGYESGTCAPMTCVGGLKNGAICVVPAPVPMDCPSPGVCTAAVEGNGCARWVGKLGTFLEAQDKPMGATNRSARLQCTPYYHDWGSEGVFHVTGAEIVPSSEYDVVSFALSCMGNEDTCAAVSPPLRLTTARSGDVEVPFQLPPPAPLSQPDVIDVAQLVNKFKNLPGAPVKAIAQLQSNLPELNADINVMDILAAVDAMKQKAYAFSGPCPCPSTVTCGSTPCSSVTPCVTAYGAGALCVKTCNGGANAGDPCINDTHCPGSTCGAGFCRDRCGRCSP